MRACVSAWVSERVSGWVGEWDLFIEYGFSGLRSDLLAVRRAVSGVSAEE